MEPGSDILNKLKESSRELYTIPEGYFESFPGQMLQKAITEPSAKVVSTSFAKRIFRYTAAAVVIGIIALGGWLWVKKPAGNENVAQNSILQNVSDSEITNYVENVPNLSTEVKEDDVKLLLADVPDEELQHYLEQDNGTRETIN